MFTLRWHHKCTEQWPHEPERETVVKQSRNIAIRKARRIAYDNQTTVYVNWHAPAERFLVTKDGELQN